MSYVTSMMLPCLCCPQTPGPVQVMAASDAQYEVDIEHLTYNHTPSVPPSLIDVSIKLPKGSRTILVGANGGELVLQLYQRSLLTPSLPQLESLLCCRF